MTHPDLVALLAPESLHLFSRPPNAELTAGDPCEIDNLTAQIDVRVARYSESSQKMLNR